MSRPPRGGRSARKPIEELHAKIRAARLKWDAMSLEERIKIGHWHSTPGPRKEPIHDGPFAAWADRSPSR